MSDLQIDDLRPGAMRKYARDAKGVLATEDDVLIAWDGANAGTVGFGLKGYAGSTIAILRTDPKEIQAPFLGYFLRSKFQYLQETCTGATIPHVSRRALEELQLTLPPLPEQKRIAAVLAKADRLRRLRRYARDLSDTYLQSVFLEMFGDPVTSPMGWEVTTLRKVASINRGKFSPRPRNDPRYYDGDHPFIQTGDIARSSGLLTEYTQTLNEEGIRVSRAFDPGTVAIAIVGATIGETAILGIRAYCPDSVIGIEADPASSTAEYAERLLRFWKPIFRARAPETARANINLETLRPLPTPLPPLALQQRYTSIAHRFERLQAQQREAQRQAEHLFQTLLHQAFQGELTTDPKGLGDP